jgi:hypothetical protein
MNLKVTPENAQGIMDTFNEWKKDLPMEKRGLVDAHVEELKTVNSLGVQGRAVCLAAFYIFFLEHCMEGKPRPKMWREA